VLKSLILSWHVTELCWIDFLGRILNLHRELLNNVRLSTKEEIKKLFRHLSGIHLLMLKLIYAGGSEAEKWVDYDYQRLRLMVEVDDYNSGEAAGELRRIQTLGNSCSPMPGCCWWAPAPSSRS
jgi:hypothetical protein